MLAPEIRSKRRGGASELLASVWLLRHGLEAFRNLSGWGMVDLIAYDPITKRTFLIDVKTKAVQAKWGREYLWYGQLTDEQREHGVVLLSVDLRTGDCSFIGDDKQPVSVESILQRGDTVTLAA